MAASSERRPSTAVPLGARQRRSGESDGARHVSPVGPPLLAEAARRICSAVFGWGQGRGLREKRRNVPSENARAVFIDLAAALGAALAAAGLASGAVAVAVALHAAMVAVRDWRDLPTGSLKFFSEHSGYVRLNTSLN